MTNTTFLVCSKRGTVYVLTIWYFQPFGNTGLQSPTDLPSPQPASTTQYVTLRENPWPKSYILFYKKSPPQDFIRRTLAECIGSQSALIKNALRTMQQRCSIISRLPFSHHDFCATALLHKGEFSLIQSSFIFVNISFKIHLHKSLFIVVSSLSYIYQN